MIKTAEVREQGYLGSMRDLQNIQTLEAKGPNT